MGAAGHGADLLARGDHRRTVPRDACRLEAQTDEPPPRPLLLYFDQRFAADKIRLAQLHRPPEPGLVRIHRLVHVVAVEAQGRLQARGVSGAKTGRQGSARTARFEYGVPDGADAVRVDEELEAILTGVAGAGDQGVDAGHLP